jgi:hypothetical protein
VATSKRRLNSLNRIGAALVLKYAEAVGLTTTFEQMKQELQEIYARLEGGSISEQEFETRELGLMQRLEQIARAKFEGNWGTPNMGLQSAFFQGPPQDDQDVVVADVIKEAEALPAIAPIPVHDGGPDVPALLLGQPAPPPVIDVVAQAAALLRDYPLCSPAVDDSHVARGGFCLRMKLRRTTVALAKVVSPRVRRSR